MFSLVSSIKNIKPGLAFPNLLYRYGTQANSHDIIKALAMIAMFADHLGVYFYSDVSTLRIVGRLAAPCFFFLIGTNRRHDFNLTLLISGLLLTALTMIVTGACYYNILLSFFLLNLFFHWQEDGPQFANIDGKTRFIKLLLIYSLLAIAIPWTTTNIEYGSVGWMFAIAGRLCALKNPSFSVCLFFTCLSYFIEELIGFSWLSNSFQAASFLVVCMFLFFSLSSYQLKEVKLPYGFKSIVLLLSRYSLWIYITHVFLFTMLVTA